MSADVGGTSFQDTKNVDTTEDSYKYSFYWWKTKAGEGSQNSGCVWINILNEL